MPYLSLGLKEAFRVLHLGFYRWVLGNPMRSSFKQHRVHWVHGRLYLRVMRGDLTSFPLTVTIATMSSRIASKALNKIPLRTVAVRGNPTEIETLNP